MTTNNSVNVGLTGQTGTGLFVGATSPTLVTPALGTPSSGVLTNCTGLPAGTGISGLAAGIATWLGAPSSANLLSALTTSTGTGTAVFSTSPTLVTPILGTPTSITLTNATGLPLSTGITGFASGIEAFLATPSSANLLAAMTTKTGTGSLVFATSPTLVTPALGTPSSGVLTNCTGLPISTGVSGLGSGISTFLSTPSSANLLSALTTSTGTGTAVFSTSPTLVTPILGAATATSLTFSPTTGGIVGTTTANNAVAGDVGEFMNSAVQIGSAVSLTSGVDAAVTTLSLTAGDWDVWGSVWTAPAGTTTTSEIRGSINLSAAISGTVNPNTSTVQLNGVAIGAGQINIISIQPCRISISITTTIYLVISCVFAISTMGGYGGISARRIR